MNLDEAIYNLLDIRLECKEMVDRLSEYPEKVKYERWGKCLDEVIETLKLEDIWDI
jgi:hypothetical protein